MKRNILYGLNLVVLMSLVLSYFTSNQSEGAEVHQRLNLATAGEPVVDPEA